MKKEYEVHTRSVWCTELSVGWAMGVALTIVTLLKLFISI
jgi:hypothetical protein